eukprot:jgi/Psemu1/325526/estExt_fgenesh1_pg.C_2510009
MTSSSQETKISVSINGTFGIDRAMPSMLVGQITEVQWTQFCDRVDDSLVPLNKYGKLLCLASMIVFLGFAGAFAFSFLSTESSTTTNQSIDNTIDDDVGGLPNQHITLLMFVVPGVLMTGMMGLGIYMAKKRRHCIGQIKTICEDISRQYQSLSFHLRDDNIFVSSGSGGTMYNDIYVLVTMTSRQDDDDLECGGGSEMAYTGVASVYPISIFISLIIVRGLKLFGGISIFIDLVIVQGLNLLFNYLIIVRSLDLFGGIAIVIDLVINLSILLFNYLIIVRGLNLFGGIAIFIDLVIDLLILLFNYLIIVWGLNLFSGIAIFIDLVIDLLILLFNYLIIVWGLNLFSGIAIFIDLVIDLSILFLIDAFVDVLSLNHCFTFCF